MPQVLVLVEHEDGATKKVTYEMLTKARDLGEPVALFVGDGLDGAREGLARHGATAVYAAGGDNRLAGPLTAALAAAADRAEPAAVLVAATPLGKDAGARLAARRGWGMLADIVDLDADLVATQNVFGGATTVRSRVRTGTPVLAVKPNSFPVAEAPAEPEVVQLDLGAEATDPVRVTDHVVQEQVGRPRPPGPVQLRPGRGPGRLPRGGGRGQPGRRRRRLVPPPAPGRPDRQDRVAPAVCGRRHLRGHPAPGRHADLQDDRRRQQGRRRAHLRHLRLRCRR